MATEKEIELIVKSLPKIYRMPSTQAVNRTNTGICAIMRYLYDADSPVTAGQISDFMNVSTARVAVLLKKMVAKELIIKNVAPYDARVSIVCLSEKGRQVSERLQNEFCEQIGKLIDKMGMEKLLDFINIAEEVGKELSAPKIDF